MKLPRSLLLAPWLALVLGASQAQESLTERRLAITKGTTPGRTVLALPGPTAAASAATAAASAPDRSRAQDGSPSPRRGLFSGLPPPSGQPLGAVRRLEGSQLGIPLATAASASASASAPASTPASSAAPRSARP